MPQTPATDRRPPKDIISMAGPDPIRNPRPDFPLYQHSKAQPNALQECTKKAKEEVPSGGRFAGIARETIKQRCLKESKKHPSN
jgi:hypothetical protein